MFHWAVRNGVVVAVAALVVCVLGLAAIFRVPVQMIPDMDLTTITVQTTWPGATPQDIETEILIEQEEYLRTIPGLVKMTSEATTGQAMIELEFALGTDINEVLIRANNALSQVPDYPENVDEPRILTSAFSDNYFLFFIIRPVPGNPAGIDLQMERDFIEDHVQSVLERVPGVSEVRIGGGANRQIRVYVDPARLAERRISFSELRQALRARNHDVSGGDLDSGKRRYLVRTVGRFQTPEDLEATIVTIRDGVPVYLRDLGHAELDHAEVRTLSTYNGEPGIMLSIKRQRGANIVQVMDRAIVVADRLDAEVLAPRGIQLLFLHSDSLYVGRSVTVIAQNLALGAGLAMMVLYLFLRTVPSTVIGAMGIPICTIAAFLGLLVMGRTINVVSLAGVAFAIGMTLDNSIVVLENIHRHLQSGKRRLIAAVDGVKEVWTAVLASTLTTVFVFLPLILIEEEAGQLYSDIAIAISASIIFSMLVATSLIPSAAAAFMTGEQRPARRSWLEAAGRQFAARVMGFVAWILPSVPLRLALIGGVVLMTAAILLLLTPKAEYLPEGEEPITFSMIFPPPGYNLQTMDEITQNLLATFAPHLQDSPADFDAGRAQIPALTWLMTMTSATGVQLIGGPKAPHHIDPLIDVLTAYTSELPGMLAFSARGSIFSGNQGGTRSMDLDISGPELAPIFQVAFEAFLRARQVLGNPQIRPAPATLSLGQPMLEIRPDWERTAELGIRADELGYLIWALTDGAYHDDFYLGDEKMDLYLYATHDTVEHPQDLSQLPIYSPLGGIVPLQSVAAIRETVNTDTIRRVNSERTVTLSIVSPRDMPLESAVQAVEQQVVGALRSEGRVPDGVTLRIAGASDKLDATRAALVENLILAVMLAYLLMVAIFAHWGYPLIIMLTVPLGIAGGIFGLWLMNLLPGIHQPLDMISMLGFLVLVGIVVNNPILLVTQARANLNAGMAVMDAVLESTRVRLRPIMMTTLTTVFGLAPLVFLPRAGTELYRGLGIIVLFGLLFSTLITLTFVPALVSLVFEATQRDRRRPAVA